MGLNNLPDNGQSETDTPFILTPGQVCLIKAFPDPLLALGRNADTRILYRHVHLVAPLGDGDVDHPALPAELDGIVNQVVEHLLDLAKVCINHLDGVGEGEIEGDPLLDTGALEGRRRVPDGMVDVKIRFR